MSRILDLAEQIIERLEARQSEAGGDDSAESDREADLIRRLEALENPGGASGDDEADSAEGSDGEADNGDGAENDSMAQLLARLEALENPGGADGETEREAQLRQRVEALEEAAQRNPTTRIAERRSRAATGTSATGAAGGDVDVSKMNLEQRAKFGREVLAKADAEGREV